MIIYVSLSYIKTEKQTLDLYIYIYIYIKFYLFKNKINFNNKAVEHPLT
jgi:hypothetical protein